MSGTFSSTFSKVETLNVRQITEAIRLGCNDFQLILKYYCLIKIFHMASTSVTFSFKNMYLVCVMSGCLKIKIRALPIFLRLSHEFVAVPSDRCLPDRVMCQPSGVYAFLYL